METSTWGLWFAANAEQKGLHEVSDLAAVVEKNLRSIVGVIEDSLVRGALDLLCGVAI